MSLFQKKVERFSVESVAKALDNNRPSEALMAIAYLTTKSRVVGPKPKGAKGGGLTLSVLDFSTPDGKKRYAQIKQIKALVRDYEQDNGVSVIGNEFFLRTRAFGLKLRGK